MVRALAALPEGAALGTHMAAHSQIQPGDPISSSGLCRHCIHVVHLHTCRQTLITRKIKDINLKAKQNNLTLNHLILTLDIFNLTPDDPVLIFNLPDLNFELSNLSLDHPPLIPDPSKPILTSHTQPLTFPT